MKPRILHLVDDTTAGGVMRVIAFITGSADMARTAEHTVQRIARGKISTTSYDADIIVSHLSISWRSLPALIALRAANADASFIHIEHSYTEAFVALNVKRQTRFSALLKVGFSLFNQIVAVSHAQADWIKRRGFCASEKVTTIQSCVDLAPFRALPTATGPARIFGAIGRLDEQKGFDTLITAFRQCSDPTIELHVFGEGPEGLKLRNMAAGDDRIVFKGFVENAIEAYATVDVVLMPSRWEAYGLVAIEALSAGRQLVCSNIDGLRDHRPLGAQIIESGSTLAWASKIDQLAKQSDTSSLLPIMRKSDGLERAYAKKFSALIEACLGLNPETRIGDVPQTPTQGMNIGTLSEPRIRSN